MTWWRRRWASVAGIVTLLVYGGIRIQIARHDQLILQTQVMLERLRPAIVRVVEAREQQAVTQAQRRWAAAMAADGVEWAAVWRGLSAALPPSVVVQTLLMDGPRMTVLGLLRYPPSAPEPYVAAMTEALKQAGAFREVVATVSPPDPDDPTVVRIQLTGTVR